MASSASHSLPDFPDILYHIFSFLDPVHHLRHEHNQVYESCRSLALAARTCRTFTGPALDVLWKRLPDDQPLADLLCQLGIAAARGEGQGDPELVGRNKPDRYRLPNQHRGGYCDREAKKTFERRWRLSRGYDIRYSLQDVGDPRQHPAWPRFVWYASRVRAITLYAFDGPAWCAIWEELRSRTDAAPILPNVLSVAFCRISWHALTPGAFALISPSVSRLNFNLGDEYSWPASDGNLRSLFSQCFTSAPGIDHLRLEFPLSRLGLPLLQAHCFRLCHLEVVPLLDLDDLRLLTGLPALQHLSISLSREDFPAASASLTFRSVSTLVVEGTWSNLAAFLAAAHLPLMHTLSITGWEYGEPAAELAKAATHVFHTLAAKHPSLPTLSVSATRGREPPSVGCVSYDIIPIADTFVASLLDLVRPLLALSALRCLSLAFPSYFDVVCTEADLRAVAEAFPALEAFHLHISRYDPGAGNPWQIPPVEEPEEAPLRGGVGAAAGDGKEPHGLRTLVIPKVLLPPGEVDAVGEVGDVVGAAFPLVSSVFRRARLVVEGGWAMAVDGAAARCPDCGRGSEMSFA
ncbi:hypothetical protein GSI_11528 [Ganoderma sinense ZZ0214-1]|uniref:F-box domain-containing protein n=1 Tax=Ganoderma sinense ZZ0214-1 TaxID=1077348 RepID=A0A2G8RWT6_9APHY|nr:hypothetical protein GSI_11528 [Ganoderma sinense ZZ0214-1]